jgi:hypothetical protein
MAHPSKSRTVRKQASSAVAISHRYCSSRLPPPRRFPKSVPDAGDSSSNRDG